MHQSAQTVLNSHQICQCIHLLLLQRLLMRCKPSLYGLICVLIVMESPAQRYIQVLTSCCCSWNIQGSLISTYHIQHAPNYAYVIFHFTAASHTALVLLEHGHSVVLIDNLNNSFERVFEHMKKLAGDKADKMKFIKVRFYSCRIIRLRDMDSRSRGIFAELTSHLGSCILL